MSRATSIAAKVSRILGSVGPQDTTCYKRVTTRTGGDLLIGRPGSITVVDTIFTPQPLHLRQSRYQVGIGTIDEEIDVAGSRRVADEEQFLFSSDSISVSDLRNESVSIVLTDSDGNSEQFRITDFEPTAYTGVTLMYNVFAKSMKRP